MGVSRSRGMPKMPDGSDLLLAMLRGGKVQKSPDRALTEQLAGVILGVALGAQTDLGRDDETILQLCKEVLERIRRAAGSPESARALEMIHEAAGPKAK